MITIWVLSLLTFLLGYYIGSRGKQIGDKIEKEIAEKFKDKPKPGVVRSLTPEELDDKYDPVKKGNLEAFDRMFAEEGIKRPKNI